MGIFVIQDNKKNELVVSKLRDAEEAKNHLNDMLQFNSESDFLFALYSVVLAQGGFANLSEKTGLCRESLYKALTPHSKPRFSTIFSIIHALTFDLKIVDMRLDKRPIVQKKVGDVLSYKRLNSLTDLYPDFSLQWNYERNDKLTPNDVAPNSRKKVWWHCSDEISHEWKASCYNRIYKNKVVCPFCDNKKERQQK